MSTQTKFLIVVSSIAFSVVLLFLIGRISSAMKESLPLPQGFEGNLSYEDACKKMEEYAPYLPRHGFVCHNFMHSVPIASAVLLGGRGNPHGEYVIGWMYETGICSTEIDRFCNWMDNAGQNAFDKNMVFPVSAQLIQLTFEHRSQDLLAAVNWFRKAADDGSAAAAAELGYMYEYGTGIPQDLNMARQWYESATLMGDMQAEIDLGSLYERGRGVKKDVQQAMMHFENARKKKSGDCALRLANYNVERLWLLGLAVPSPEFRRCETDAMTYVSKYADFWEAGCLAEVFDFGFDCRPDHSKALELYKICVPRCPESTGSFEDAGSIGNFKQRLGVLEAERKKALKT